MTIDAIRAICSALPAVTEDIKWGHDLCFCVSGKMFAAVDLAPPHSMAFKCTPESFGELVERPGIIPAPYAARHMWVMEQELGKALERGEVVALIKTAYDLVVAKLPKSKRPGAPTPTSTSKAGLKARPISPKRGSRSRKAARGRRPRGRRGSSYRSRRR
ncbi:MAG TPA: MmcQ/YjbR family DNA-binding protein [Vicinamibacterales bacterium]|jgi:predicted DNA-binding protein (MmcQ/YjbR family)|nr:MmcQ/YjbR family DNA-binding protein [Vicinamibacterales bacterium]